MSSFASLLSSISGQPQPPKPATNTSRPATGNAGPANGANGVRSATNNVVAGVKRKPEDQAAAPNAKVVKTEVNVPVRPPGQPSAAKPIPAPTGEYKGTARAAGAAPAAKPALKPLAKPGAAAATTTPSSAAPPTPNGAVQPKRGFASIMEKAKAAQEAAKAAGSSTIKHKPVEKLSRREKLRLEQNKQKQAGGTGKLGKVAANDRSRSNTPVDPKAALKKAPEPAYKGTMKKPVVEKQEFTYKGTMRKVDAAAAKAKQTAKKGPEGKYNGYASWSDLDDAEDEEQDYESESDMDAGFDDMESEERKALAAARKEDQEALEEEEQHKREKLERKRKLQALSKSAAARKKF